LVIIPAELLPNNGRELQTILQQLAAINHLPSDFIDWMNTANDFCNSLVDRIVPGKLPVAEAHAAWEKLGYHDELMLMSEVYRLWAIETSSTRTKEILSFAAAEEGVVVQNDIEKFRELKLRLLNGPHTFCCSIGLLMGFSTVKAAMANSLFLQYMKGLMQEEIIPAITQTKISEEEGIAYAQNVIERFRNPFLEHQWHSISLQYTSKMKMRNVPVLLKYYEREQRVPQYMAVGFAAYIFFMKSTLATPGHFNTLLAGKTYVINDDMAGTLHELWQVADRGRMIENILQDDSIWGANLSVLPGFTRAVATALQKIEQEGMDSILSSLLTNKKI